jgi:hypothetical protein
MGGSGGTGTGGTGGTGGSGSCVHCFDAFHQGYHGNEPGVSFCGGPSGALWSMYNCACATTGCGDVGAPCDANWCEGSQVPTSECEACVLAVCGSASYTCQLN